MFNTPLASLAQGSGDRAVPTRLRNPEESRPLNQQACVCSLRRGAQLGEPFLVLFLCAASEVSQPHAPDPAPHTWLQKAVASQP